MLYAVDFWFSILNSPFEIKHNIPYHVQSSKECVLPTSLELFIENSLIYFIRINLYCTFLASKISRIIYPEQKFPLSQPGVYVF